MEDPHITLAEAKDELLDLFERLRKSGIGVNMTGALNIGAIHLEIKEGSSYTFL